MLRKLLFTLIGFFLAITSTVSFAQGKCGPLPPTMMLMQNDVKQQLNLTAQQLKQWNRIESKLKQVQVMMQPANRQVKAVVDTEASKTNPTAAIFRAF